jgi:hypothetical protein
MQLEQSVMVRGPISLLIVGAISLFMFLLVSLGPRGFEGILPEPVIAMLESGGGMVMVGEGGGSILGGSKKTSGNTPSDMLIDGRGGLIADGPIAALEGNRPVFIDAVLEGHETRIAKHIPAEITTIRAISGCKPTPPQAGTVVGHVMAADSDLGLSLLTYNDQTLAAAVQQFVDVYRNVGMAKVEVGPGLAYQSYDVAVTETGSPVYLVLVNMYGHRVWNIHLAPGARVERVVLLGGGQAGVANLDPVVPVEVMSAMGLADCGIVPAYAANTGTDTAGAMAQAPGLGGDEAEAEAELKQAGLDALVTAWNTWFRDSFGVLADETRAGFDKGMVSVVGPLPGEADPKAVYAPIEGSRIRVTQDKYFEIRGQSAKAESFAGRVEAIATSFAFGDLKFLRQGVSF